MRLPFRKPGKFAKPAFDPHITKDKYAEIKNSLTRLRTKRPIVADEVARHAQMGDFSENAEYQAAKHRLRGINSRILILENQLKQAIIIDSKSKSDIVRVGGVVTVTDEKKESTYEILGSAESDPARGVISQNSPIGAALMGRRVGDEVVVLIAGKERQLKILKVT